MAMVSIHSEPGGAETSVPPRVSAVQLVLRDMGNHVTRLEFVDYITLCPHGKSVPTLGFLPLPLPLPDRIEDALDMARDVLGERITPSTCVCRVVSDGVTEFVMW